MDLRITARHFDLTIDLREHAEDKILPLTKYFNHVLDAALVLTMEKHRHKAELSFSIAGKKLFAKTETNDMFASIDEVSSKIERMLRNHHDKLMDHKSAENQAEKKEFLTEIGS